MWCVILITLLNIITFSNGFTVDIVNITSCDLLLEETGELTSDLGSEESADQLFSGSFTIPEDLNEDAYIEYESYALDEDSGEWLFLFSGVRSLCNSAIKSLPYKRFRDNVEPKWPTDCPIPANTYELSDFPISGQYVVLSDIRDISPLVQHRLNLWSEDNLIFCRDIYTISSN